MVASRLMGSRVLFTEADIKRAMRAMDKAGRPVAAIDFPKEGGFRLLIGEPVEIEKGSRGKNEWDDVLPQ